MKKIFALATAAAGMLVASIGLAACGEGGNYSEAFAGALSEESYETTDAAATAFLQNEIASADTPAEFVSYAKTADITEEELAQFDLGALEPASIQSMEWGQITYTVTGNSAASLAATDTDETLEVKVGMFGVGDAFYYFVPVAGTGEMISKSYYESVFDPSQYVNCTQTFKAVVKTTASAQGYSTTVKVTTKYTIKVTEDAASIDVSVSGVAGQPATHISAYIIETAGGITAYTKVGGVWSVNYDIVAGFDRLEDLFKVNLTDFVDYSYFEKTDSGFKLAPLKYREFLDQYAESLNYGGALDFDGEATYFVSEGRLAKATTKLTLAMDQYADGLSVSISVSASATNSFSGFGTTTVTLPADFPVQP